MVFLIWSYLELTGNSSLFVLYSPCTEVVPFLVLCKQWYLTGMWLERILQVFFILTNLSEPFYIHIVILLFTDTADRLKYIKRIQNGFPLSSYILSFLSRCIISYQLFAEIWFLIGFIITISFFTYFILYMSLNSYLFSLRDSESSI